MPLVNNEDRRREFMRSLALSRKKGDFITCDCPLVTPLDRARLAAEAEAKKAEDRRWFEKSTWL